jgi:hypothetical protein
MALTDEAEYFDIREEQLERRLQREHGLSRRQLLKPQGLDSEVITNGVNEGHVRRPLPVAKALDDALLAYGMNGEGLPPGPGSYQLRARATDQTGQRQPETVPFNKNGYLFWAVVRHPVQVA